MSTPTTHQQFLRRKVKRAEQDAQLDRARREAARYQAEQKEKEAKQ